jgi:hypothetical protein
MWTPTVEGIYIVNASATPVPGETATANNVRTAIVHVRSITVALISDNQELHLSAVPSILDSMNIGYTIYDYNNVILFTEHADVMLRYQTVIFDNDDRNTTAAEHSALQAFLAGGGNLLVTGYDSLGHPNDPYLADIVCSSLTGDNTGEPDLYVRSATHPIMNGPYGTFAAGYHITGLYSDCDSAEADTSRGAVTVAELADGRDKIIATQCYPGRVVYWNGAGEMDWSGNANCQAMFKNLMVWFSTAAAATSVYLVVRGLTNAINYTVCDTTTHTLGAWASLPGATSETPAAAKIGNELHVVVKGSSSNSLYHGYVNLNNGTFSGWSLLSENSNTMPTLTTNGTLLFLVIRTPTNVIEYSSYSIATRTWSAWTVLPGSTPTSPGATAVGNQLYVVVKGSSSNMLYQGYANTNNATFVGWTILTENSTSMPTMTNNGSKVFLVIQNQSNVIKYSSYSIATRTWSAWTVLPGSTPVCPGATAVNNQLYLIVKGSSSNMLYQGYVNLSTDAFSGWSTTTGLSPSGPTLTS